MQKYWIWAFVSVCNIVEHTERDRESEIEIGRKRGKEREIKTEIEIERKEERERALGSPTNLDIIS